ncbi:hypothetical protein [Cohnella yongneupensis]|uniref:YopX protein domain-containing protein n=1 Tax=Cohnella yongneupensis TaxID=425006 RepID=A0ABW0R954_9BACL
MPEVLIRFWHKQDKSFINLHAMGWRFDPSNGQVYIDGMNVTDRVEIVPYTGVHDDETNTRLFVGSIIEFVENDIHVVGSVEIEGGRLLLASNDYDDGYAWLQDAIENDGDHFWIQGSRYLGNRFENPKLLTGGKAE